MSGLSAAIHLARGQPGPVADLPAEASDVAQSFVTVALASVPLVTLRLMLWAAGDGIPANAIHLLLHDLLVFVVSWLGFIVITHRLADRLGRAPLWPRFVILYNWCNVVANSLVLLGAIPELLGAPAIIGQVSQVVVAGWALWLSWYLIRLTLRTGPLLALYLVLVEQTIGISFTIAAATFAPK
jgi:hypothetical protein